MSRPIRAGIGPRLHRNRKAAGCSDPIALDREKGVARRVGPAVKIVFAHDPSCPVDIRHCDSSIAEPPKDGVRGDNGGFVRGRTTPDNDTPPTLQEPEQELQILE
ncbi:hypothetical protein [Sphingomonas sp. PP-F2F-G114-C0414]|uniref:hypothetical protein n=1 Tax=Sphingomonas sp. PP-F2F-G114-C0414 TaxID=2135662 RepID=UPI0011C3E807|nr:hypothetical protein [Sphingomonas sp. PP-F2F-G114-C0414]